MHKPYKEFHHPHYLNINFRRLEHLASLGFSFRDKTVVELGAGIGDLSPFFLAQGAILTIVEGRPENIEVLRNRFPEKSCPDVNIVETDLNSPGSIPGQPFDIVFSYGVLYHLADPESAIGFMKSVCNGLLLLETCVSPSEQHTVEQVKEDAVFYSQALDGIASRPGREWVHKELVKKFQYVYMPKTQPDHEEFNLDWESPKPAESGLLRAIFVASENEIGNSSLVSELPQKQSVFAQIRPGRPASEKVGINPPVIKKDTMFEDFSIAKKQHFKLFFKSSRELYGEGPDLECNLKIYQDLLVYTFIREHIPAGSRLLEVGGGDSRVLDKLSEQYECWNLDKLEGLGYGPCLLESPPYRLVKAYAGDFAHELPDNYFDIAFSISALEHTPPDDPELYGRIAADIDRVLKKGAYSLHCIDVVLSVKMEKAYYDYMFYEGSLKGHDETRIAAYNTLPDSDGSDYYCPNIINHFACLPNVISSMPDLQSADSQVSTWTMPQKEYDSTWKKYVVKKEYSLFGKPTSVNVLWQNQI